MDLKRIYLIKRNSLNIYYQKLFLLLDDAGCHKCPMFFPLKGNLICV